MRGREIVFYLFAVLGGLALAAFFIAPGYLMRQL